MTDTGNESRVVGGPVEDPPGIGERPKPGALWSGITARVLLGLVVVGLVVVAALALRDCDSPTSSWSNLACFEPDVAIFVQSPEVYTRARLLNDRNDQKNWLTEQLEQTKKIQDFVTREEEASRSLNEKLRLGAQIAHRDAALPPENSKPDPQAQTRADNNVPAPPAPSRSVLDRRPTSLLFKEINEHREEIRSELSRIQLDDRHDLGGNTAYTLRFPTSVVGDFPAGRIGLLRVRAELPRVTLDKVEVALESWRNNVQNVYSSSLRDIALSLSSAGDQSLEDLGLSSSDFREYVVHKMLCERMEQFCPPHERNLHKPQDPATVVMATRDGRTLAPVYAAAPDVRTGVESLASDIRNFLPNYLQSVDELNGLLEEWTYYKRRDSRAATGALMSPTFDQALAGCFALPEYNQLPDATQVKDGEPRDVVLADVFQVRWRYKIDGTEWKLLHPCSRSDRGTAWIARAIFRLVDARNFGEKFRDVGPLSFEQFVRERRHDVVLCRKGLLAEIPADPTALVPDDTRDTARLPEACKGIISSPADVSPGEPALRRTSTERWGTARLQELRCAIADFRAYQATWRKYLSPGGDQISFSDFFDVVALRYGNQGCDLEVRVKFRGNRTKVPPDICPEDRAKAASPYVQSLCQLRDELSIQHSLFALGLAPTIIRRNVNNQDSYSRSFAGQGDSSGTWGALVAAVQAERHNARMSKDSMAAAVSFVPHTPESAGSTNITAFGWIFLPDAANRGARQFDLTATLSLPGWVTDLTVHADLCFGTYRELAGMIDGTGPAPSGRCRPAPIGSIRLPGDSAEITRKLNLEVFYFPHLKLVAGINDFSSAGATLRAGYPGVLLIPGRRLWKNTYVTLGEQLANEISILPDMEGIVARFNCVHVPIEIVDKFERDKGKAPPPPSGENAAKSAGPPGRPPAQAPVETNPVTPNDQAGLPSQRPPAMYEQASEQPQYGQTKKWARVWTSEGATSPISVTIEQFGKISLCPDQRLPVTPATAPPTSNRVQPPTREAAR